MCLHVSVCYVCNSELLVLNVVQNCCDYKPEEHLPVLLDIFSP